MESVLIKKNLKLGRSLDYAWRVDLSAEDDRKFFGGYAAEATASQLVLLIFSSSDLANISILNPGDDHDHPRNGNQKNSTVYPRTIG